MQNTRSWDTQIDNKELDISLVEKRKQLCSDCEYFNNVLKICNQCGCFMPIKIRMGNIVSCPKGKW